MRIGDVALDAVNGGMQAEGTASTGAVHVGQARTGGRFANDAVIDALPARAQLFNDVAGTVNGGAFFIAGDQDRKGAFDRPAATARSAATISAARLPFMSAAPRPTACRRHRLPRQRAGRSKQFRHRPAPHRHDQPASTGPSGLVV